jgi:hypothetical protein
MRVFGFVLLAIAVATAFAADRVVLFEEYTSIG